MKRDILFVDCVARITRSVLKTTPLSAQHKCVCQAHKGYPVFTLILGHRQRQKHPLTNSLTRCFLSQTHTHTGHTLICLFNNISCIIISIIIIGVTMMCFLVSGPITLHLKKKTLMLLVINMCRPSNLILCNSFLLRPAAHPSTSVIFFLLLQFSVCPHGQFIYVGPQCWQFGVWNVCFLFLEETKTAVILCICFILLLQIKKNT